MDEDIMRRILVDLVKSSSASPVYFKTFLRGESKYHVNITVFGPSDPSGAVLVMVCCPLLDYDLPRWMMHIEGLFSSVTVKVLPIYPAYWNTRYLI
jgi:hypothetical protein